ncbi:MAG: WD40/YVTN/BNR-like repeat-containing protein, partial [Candidatus Kapaibacterium sp.]
MFAQAWIEPGETTSKMNFYEIQDRFHEYWDGKTPTKGQGWKQFKRLEYFWEDRIWPTGEFPDATEVMRGWERWQNSYKPQDSPLADKEWKFVGPSTRPEKREFVPDPGMGRINCVAFHPSNPNIILAGAAFGGVWRSMDGGQTWETFPFTSFLSIGISDVAIAKSDPNVIYAATGDADSFGVLGVNFNFSIGIIKSTDAGNTWEVTNFNPEIINHVIINDILVHPVNSNVVYAASNAGLIVTTNGGQGWTLIEQGNFREIEFKPNDPDIIYAALQTQSEYQLRKYIASSGTMNTTMRLEGVSRIELAVTPADNNIIYGLCSDYRALGAFAAVIKSTDAGESWSVVASAEDHPNYLDFSHDGSGPNGQGLYDLSIAVHPNNKDMVFIGGVNVWKSLDGGSSWELAGEWTGNFGAFVHADHHELEFHPGGRLYSANDGGIRWTSDGGESWNDISDGLEVTQFYRISTYAKDKNLMYGGTQDNGTHKYVNGQWKNVRGGDGMECIVDYTNSDYVYVSIYNGDFVRSTDGGESFEKMINPEDFGEEGAWVTPMAMDPNDPKVLYVGYYNVYKSTDRGTNWTKLSNINTQGATMRTIAVAPSNTRVIYAAYTGAVLKSLDGGTNWQIIYQSQDAPIKDICVDPGNANRIWVTFSGYNLNKKVIEINGSNVSDRSRNLPKVPINTIVYQPESPDRLYVGTDVGVFFNDNTVQDWQLFNAGLPNVVVNELEIHVSSGIMRAATYGRGLWEVELVDCNLPAPGIRISNGDPDALCNG